MSESPRFSIVIPAFNYARFIDRVVASIERQALRDFEVVIVDDGSSDNTGAAVRAAFDAHLGGRGVYVRQENLGVAAARNTGVARARGDWVLLLDADDELEPHALATFDRAIAQYPAATVLFGGYRSVTPTLRGDKVRANPATPLTDDPVENFRRFIAREIDGLTPGSLLVRRDVIARVGFDPRLRLTEDTVFFGRLLATEPAASIGGREGIVLRTHRHPNSSRRNVGRLLKALPYTVDSLFDPAHMPAAAMRYRDAFAGWLGLEVATVCYRNGLWRASAAAYADTVREHPRQLLRPRHFSRFVRACAMSMICPKPEE